MQKDILQQAAQYLQAQRRRKIWLRVVSVLSAIVVFCTSYALILPAITLDKGLFCGFEEHTHSDGCYTAAAGQEPALVCSPQVHAHTSDCTDAQGNFICGQADYLAHSHNEFCYDAQGNIRCQLQEAAGHTHDDSCYTITEGHTHGEDCFVLEQGALICTLTEGEGHAHGESCYEKTLICAEEEHDHGEDCYEKTLICTMEEAEAHSHGDDCYETVSSLICEKQESESVRTLVCTELQTSTHIHSESCLQVIADETLVCTLQEHEHSLACYSDPEADVETAEDWEKTFADEELTGKWREDTLIIARTQLGYTESTKNYVVNDEGEIKGYTRYGAWYGIPYGDWCAMFAAFCLDHAGVDMPMHAACANWIDLLSQDEYDLFREKADYIPQSGDLIFFDRNGDGRSDHVGLVEKVSEATETEAAKIHTIEGNTKGNQVAIKEYDLNDSDIVGYGELPAQLSAEEQAQVDSVIALIDEMPSADAIDSQLEAFEEQEDEEVAQSWYMDVVRQVVHTYHAYQTLSEKQQSFVTNADKLMELEYIWSAYTLEELTNGELYCGYEAHTHADGTCICANTEEHEHSSECCLLEEHTHTEACELEGEYYCNKITHVHGISCYDETGKLICEQYEHLHHDYCAQLPLKGVHAQHSVEGTYYSMVNPKYSNYPAYYQASSHLVYNGRSSVANLTYVLVSDQYVSSSKDTITLEPVHWTAKTDANYLVAYCAEPYTSTADGGATYSSVVIDNSRFTSEEQRRRMSGIISHAYPYLSYAELKDELEKAYANGELSCDIANCPSCTENEYLAATQAAIWALVDPAYSYSKFSGASNIVGSAVYLNPHVGERTGYVGHGDTQLLDDHCNAIKTWLLKQIVPEKLAVADFQYEITRGEHETYDLTVTAEFDRAVIAGESVEGQLVAGDQKSERVVSAVGDTGFTAVLQNITEKELLEAQVSLRVSGEQLQAYFFNSDQYQDFVSGLWEEYENDISFAVGVDKTDVSVTKIWSEGIPEDVESVEVQLYADGKEYGEPILLNRKNHWQYTWTDLMKANLLGEDIRYTIQEKQTPGYYSTLSTAEQETVTVDAWICADTFREGGKYLIVGSDGALGVHEFGGSPALTWEAVDLSDPDAADDMLIWQANGITDDSGALLASMAYPDQPLGINSKYYVLPEGTLDAVSGSVYYENSHMYMLDANGAKRYFVSMYSSGEYRTSTSATSAAKLTLYELQQVEVPAAETNYLLTNTKITGDVTDYTITKSWSGREDGKYPEEAVVYLTRNGEQYGPYVTLNAENEWTHVWKDLLAADADGNAFAYSVQELDVPNYEGVFSPDETQKQSMLLENRWTPEQIPLLLQKVSTVDATRWLPGAGFDLYMASDNGTGTPIPGTDGAGVYGYKIAELMTDENGMVDLTGVVAAGERYYLVETKAPDGYNRLYDAIGFTVTQRGTLVTVTMLTQDSWVDVSDGVIATMTVRNAPSYSLPKTGGNGPWMFTLIGMLLLMGAAGGLVYGHNRRREVK